MANQIRIAIIGCGIIGALTAYELSQDDRFQVTVLDRQQPGQGSTGAALGVLMGVISHKTKGRRWQRCWSGLERYETLVPELEAITGRAIPFNQTGLLRLCFAGEDLEGWRRLAAVRAKQDLPLEVLEQAELARRYPQVQHGDVIGAVYSARDRQLAPQALTQALVQAAQANGVQFRFDAAVSRFSCSAIANKGTATAKDTANGNQQCKTVQWADHSLEADQVVITAGLGSTGLIQQLNQELELRPVLGQALRVSLERPLTTAPQPVINGQDIHIAPLPMTEGGPAEYWIGATVELPDGQGHPPGLDPARLDDLWQSAIGFCPALAQAKILGRWSGLRPRPEGRPAPVLEPLAGYDNVLLATGHYRNGVLLAPASAQWVQAELAARLPLLQ